jgi:hypothetical protein
MNISQYKSKIASRYIPVEPELIGNKIFEADYYYTSIKYDGFFAVLEIKDGKVSLFDRNANVKEIAAQSNRYLIGVHEKHELLPNVYPPPPRDYWSSTHNSDSINYWSFSYGEQVDRNHTSKNFVRAVRSV